MTQASESIEPEKVIKIPTWAIGFGKWIIGVLAGLFCLVATLEFAYRSNVTENVSMIPGIKQEVDKTNDSVKAVKKEIRDHSVDFEAHPNLDRISTQIENLDRTIQGRSQSVDKKLDSIDARVQRQWEAISEIRQRSGP